MEQRRSAQQLRPWYLTLALCMTWLVGVFGAASGCSDVEFLRGSRDAPRMLRSQAEDNKHPLLRSSAVRETARLEALKAEHRRAFPLSLAKLLLALALVLVSGAALAGRSGSRTFAMQTIVANGLLAALRYALTGVLREAVALAVATDAVDHGGLLPQLTREESIALLSSVYGWADAVRLGVLEVGIFGGALYALSRARSKTFYAAVAAGQDGKPSSK